MNGPEWKYLLTCEERTKIDISKRLLLAITYYQRTLGLRTLTEATALAITLGIRDDLQYQSPMPETVRMLEGIIKEKGLKLKPKKHLNI